MQVNRLFEITYLLLEKDTISARELAERFNVSTRTIYRDIDTLSTSGVPIYMKKGKNGGISLLANCTLNKTVLTAEEKGLLLSALNSINTFDNVPLNNTLSKLDAFFNVNTKNFIEIDYSDWGNLIKEQFEISKKAILNNNIMNFNYISSDNNFTNREVEPIILWFKDKNWYLKAYCLDKKEERIFKLTRMRNISISDKKFINRNFENITIEDKGNYETIKVILKISSEMKFRILDEFEEKDVISNQDGTYTVTLNCIENDWIYNYIFSYGANAEVLEPLSVRNTIIKKLEDNLKKYL